MILNGRALFDGWEISSSGTPAADGETWCETPAAGEGLFVAGLDDGSVAALPPCRSLLVHGGSLSRKSLPGLVARTCRLALVDCAGLAGGFEQIAESPLTHLWIAGASGFELRGLQPIAGSARLLGLFLDGTAPASLFRWLAPLTSLRALDLSRPADAPEVGRGLAALAGLHGVERLALRRAHVTDGVLRQIGAMPALRRLDLSGCTISAEARTWKKLRHLVELRLRGVRGLAQAAAGVESLEALVVLDLGGLRLDPRQRDRLGQALPDLRILEAPAPVAASPHRPASPASPPAAATPPLLPVPGDPPEPLRWPEDAPSLASLHVVIPDERGNLIGFDKRYDLGALAQRFRAADLLRGLEDGGASPEQRAAALMLLPPALAHADPNANRLTDAAIAACHALLSDPGAVEWAWSGSSTSRFEVRGLATVALLALFDWRAQRRLVPLAGDLPLLRDVLLAELGREAGTPWYVSSHLIGRQRDPTFPAAVSAWVEWLSQVMHDSSAPPRARVAAMERLWKDRERMPASVRDKVEAAWQRTVESLAHLAAAETTEMHFRREARRLVAKLAPALLDAMRDRGELPSRPLPAYGRIAGGIGAPDRQRVLAVAPDIDGSACVAALAAGDVAAWFSALAFAPCCANAEEARVCAERAAALIGRGDSIELAPGNAAKSERLGDAAASALAALVRERGVSRHGLLDRVLAALRQLELDPTLVTPPGALVAIQAVAPAPAGEPQAAPEVLRARLLDRSAGPAERFLLLLCCYPLQKEHAQRILADADEDGDLRALLGCLHGLAQPPGREPLPLSEPSSQVPIANLRASLRLGGHPVSVRRATQALVSRLLPWDAEGEALARGAEELRAIPLPATLRSIVEGPRGLGRLAGARWLAILGESQDRPRIARVMVEEGGFAAQRPQETAPRTGIERLLAALVNETVVDHCTSDFEPLLRLGFGAERTPGILAEAYVLIARRHAAAGNLSFARRSAAFAASLDPLSLEAARLLRSLG